MQANAALKRENSPDNNDAQSRGGCHHAVATTSNPLVGESSSTLDNGLFSTAPQPPPADAASADSATNDTQIFITSPTASPPACDGNSVTVFSGGCRGGSGDPHRCNVEEQDIDAASTVVISYKATATTKDMRQQLDTCIKNNSNYNNNNGSKDNIDSVIRCRVEADTSLREKNHADRRQVVAKEPSISTVLNVTDIGRVVVGNHDDGNNCRRELIAGISSAAGRSVVVVDDAAAATDRFCVVESPSKWSEPQICVSSAAAAVTAAVTVVSPECSTNLVATAYAATTTPTATRRSENGTDNARSVCANESCRHRFLDRTVDEDDEDDRSTGRNQNNLRATLPAATVAAAEAVAARSLNGKRKEARKQNKKTATRRRRRSQTEVNYVAESGGSGEIHRVRGNTILNVPYCFVVDKKPTMPPTLKQANEITTSSASVGVKLDDVPRVMGYPTAARVQSKKRRLSIKGEKECERDENERLSLGDIPASKEKQEKEDAIMSSESNISPAKFSTEQIALEYGKFCTPNAESTLSAINPDMKQANTPKSKKHKKLNNARDSHVDLNSIKNNCGAVSDSLTAVVEKNLNVRESQPSSAGGSLNRNYPEIVNHFTLPPYSSVKSTVPQPTSLSSIPIITPPEAATKFGLSVYPPFQMFHPYFLMGISLNPFLTLPYPAAAAATTFPVASAQVSALSATSKKQTPNAIIDESIKPRPKKRRRKSTREANDVTSTTSDSNALFPQPSGLLGSKAPHQRSTQLNTKSTVHFQSIEVGESEARDVEQCLSREVEHGDLRVVGQGELLEGNTNESREGNNGGKSAITVQSKIKRPRSIGKSVKMKQNKSSTSTVTPLKKADKKTITYRGFEYDACGAMDLSAQKKL